MREVAAYLALEGDVESKRLLGVRVEGGDTKASGLRARGRRASGEMREGDWSRDSTSRTKETMGTRASIVRTESGSTHAWFMRQRASEACHVSSGSALRPSRVPGASGIAVVVRTGGSVTTRSMSDPGRIKPVANEPNAFTCARGQRSDTTERTLEMAAWCTAECLAKWLSHSAS